MGNTPKNQCDITHFTNQAVSIEEDSETFSKQVLSYLNACKISHFADENRQFVENNFSWDASLKRLTQMID